MNDLRSIVNTTAINAGFVLGSNISEDFDFTISYAGSYTFSKNSTQPDTNSNYYSHTISFKWVWTFWKEVVLRNDVSNAYTSGASQGFNQNLLLFEH